jgi:2-dehydropantoate 2-reductase
VVKDKVPSFAVLGVGAVGGLYGGLLAKSGYPVHFLARSDADYISQHGLRVDTLSGDFNLPKVQVYNDPQNMPVVDVVLVAWKTTSNDQLELVLPAICGPETDVLVLQNGLDVERMAARVVGSNRVMGACVFLCSHKVGPGHIQHLDYGNIAFGEYDKAKAGRITDRLLRLEAVLQSAGIDAKAVESLAAIRWKKLAWNIPFNGLSVVLQADTSQVMQNEGSCQLAEDLMREVVACATACGVTIPDEHIAQNLEYTRKMVPYASSMLLDYRVKRPLELDAIFGEPIRQAIMHGYHPIRVEMLYRQLTFLDIANRSLPRT